MGSPNNPKKPAKKWGTFKPWVNTKNFAGTRKSVRALKLGGLGNGSKSGAFFNGKHDKHVKKAKEFVPPVYSPEGRGTGATPTSRYAHKPWPFKRKIA